MDALASAPCYPGRRASCNATQAAALEALESAGVEAARKRFAEIRAYSGATRTLALHNRGDRIQPLPRKLSVPRPPPAGPRFQIWSFAITLCRTCDFVCPFTTSPFSGRLSVYHVVNGQTDFAGRDFVCPFTRCPFARLPRLHFPPAFAPDKKSLRVPGRLALEL